MQIIMMINNIINLGYTYTKQRLNKPPKILYQIAHTSKLIAWTPSILSCNPALRGRDLSLLNPRFTKAFTGTNNKEGQTVSDNSTRYTLWDSGYNHSINPYFDLYTEYKPLGKEDGT